MHNVRKYNYTLNTDGKRVSEILSFTYKKVDKIRDVPVQIINCHTVNSMNDTLCDVAIVYKRLQSNVRKLTRTSAAFLLKRKGEALSGSAFSPSLRKKPSKHIALGGACLSFNAPFAAAVGE